MKIMKVALKDGFKYTSTVIDALQASTRANARMTWSDNGPRSTKVWWWAGIKFNGNKAFGIFLINEINDWMCCSGLVDLNLLANVRYDRTDCPFSFTEEV